MALHGRDADLSLLDETLAAARAGHGRALFLTGEAGIGKSTLLTEARARAEMSVLAGAAWESGGAPAYWPWQQVLRDLASQLGGRVDALPGAPQIAALVPEWGASTAVAATDPAAAKFALLDGVVRALHAVARQQPLTILLDDLHAADLPSLDLLVMLVRDLPRVPIALVAAWREGELAVRTEAAQRLARASRAGTVQPLRRLSADEVTRWVGKDGAAIFAATDGNPLFVEETLRARRGGSGRGVATVIADHLALASEATRKVLEVASVLGRDFEPGLLREVARSTDDAIAAALREAAAVGIVDRHGNGWRFRHVLLRDHLYEQLSPSERTALHRAAGAALEPIDASRAAHHLLAGAGDDVPHVVAVAREAATRASRVYAFEEAADLLAAAARALEATAARHDAIAIDVRIELAVARHHVGGAQLARADCMKAAELARSRGDVERFARAAMVYASDLTLGRDPTMIALLDEAAAQLSTSDSCTRARVMARLASALVPGPEPEVLRAQQIARDAVAMARRLGDPDTTLFALRFATHAHGFLISVEEGLALTNEIIAIADQIGRPLEALDHRSWQVGAYLALGDLDAAHTAFEHYEALASPLEQPQYRWRLPLLRAATASRHGDFAEADQLISIVREIAHEYDLPRASWAARFTTFGVMAATRDPARAIAVLGDGTREEWSRLGPAASNFFALMLAVAGRRDEALVELDRALFVRALVVIQFGAEAAVLLRSQDHARKLLPVFEEQCALHPLLHGPQSSLAGRPSAQVLGEIYALLGRTDEAIVALERGLALARAIESRPSIAHGGRSLADALATRGDPRDRERIAALRTEASRLARVLGIHGFAEVAPEPSSAPLEIRCDGERARVRWKGREIVLASAKGFEFLATLTEAPNREIHVSELVGDDDRGDAGEMLDAKARAHYRERVDELKAELEAARAGNDLGRAERLGDELEAVTDELLRATGLGGRTRKAGSRVERARINVQRRIKDAIRRIAAEDEALGRYLDATVRTGTFCSFFPI